MPLKPFDLTDFEPTPIPEELSEILSANGLSSTIVDGNDKSELDHARKIFKSNGATLDKAARTVSDIMDHGDSDAGRLKASELALKVHGILNELNDRTVPQITINVTGSDNKTLINLVVPT